MIPVFKPFLKRQDMQSVLSCLVTDDIGPSARTKDLVREMSHFFRVHSGAAFREYYRAVQTTCRVLEIGEGDSVVISPLAPRVYGDVLRNQGIRPLYADVDPDTACLDPRKAVELAGEQTKAVFLHYPLGFVPDITGLTELGIPIVEDVTQAVGARRDGQPVGIIGDIVLVSLEPDNIITAGGGTVLLLRNRKQSKTLRDITDEMTDDVFLSDINASLGAIQFSSLFQILETRQQIFDIYWSSIMKSRHQSLQQKDESAAVPYSFPVLLETGFGKVEHYAKKKGIEVTQAFRDTIIGADPEGEFGCPAASSLLIRCVLFPLYAGLSRDNVVLISKILATLP
jgi:dTDP-4-amino-4,6-dideoxygalactose transaminase